MDTLCKNCKKPIRLLSFAWGETWRHCPNEESNIYVEHCRLSVAEPEDKKE